jgi:hypothetical protein
MDKKYIKADFSLENLITDKNKIDKLDLSRKELKATFLELPLTQNKSEKQKNLEKLFELLSNREYRDETTSEIEKFAKDNNFVIMFGASDDLLEFRGAYFEEFGASNKTKFYFNKNMSIFYNKNKIDIAKLLNENRNIFNGLHIENNFEYELELLNKIEVFWCKNEDNYAWSYKTNFPSISFDILEDGEIYSQGIIFSLDDLF